jgi:hypothetical protein
MAFQFKLKTESVNKLSDDVKTLFNKVITNKQMLNEIGEAVVTDIQVKTKKGYSIPNNSTFKALSRKWINRRTKLADVNPVDEAFAPAKSNLTFTGELLKSIIFTISKGKLEFDFEDTHAPYNNTNGELIGGGSLNSEIAQGMKEQGRPFFGLSRAVKLKANSIVKKFMKRALKVQRLLK